MAAEPRVDFFPKTETIVFIVAVIVFTVIELLLGLKIWHLIVTIIFGYFLIMGGASALTLEDDLLTITSLNPFLGSHSINIKSITKIKPLDTIDRQKETDFGSYFLFYSRRCLIVYLNEEQQKQNAFFSILNKKEEKRVLKGLRKLAKKDKIAPEQRVESEEDEDDDEEFVQGS